LGYCGYWLNGVRGHQQSKTQNRMNDEFKLDFS